MADCGNRHFPECHAASFSPPHSYAWKGAGHLVRRGNQCFLGVGGVDGLSSYWMAFHQHGTVTVANGGWEELTGWNWWRAFWACLRGLGSYCFAFGCPAARLCGGTGWRVIAGATEEGQEKFFRFKTPEGLSNPGMPPRKRINPPPLKTVVLIYLEWNQLCSDGCHWNIILICTVSPISSTCQKPNWNPTWPNPPFKSHLLAARKSDSCNFWCMSVLLWLSKVYTEINMVRIRWQTSTFVFYFDTPDEYIIAIVNTASKYYHLCAFWRGIKTHIYQWDYTIICIK